MSPKHEQRDNEPLNLEWHQGRNRVLLIFVPSPEDARYTQQQERFFGHSNNMLDRDLISYYIFEDEDVSAPADPSALAPESAARTRDQYGVGEGEFAVVLIGKDGTEKERYGQPVAAETIFEAVDAMPMRQEEMKK